MRADQRKNSKSNHTCPIWYYAIVVCVWIILRLVGSLWLTLAGKEKPCVVACSLEVSEQFSLAQRHPAALSDLEKSTLYQPMHVYLFSGIPTDLGLRSCLASMYLGRERSGIPSECSFPIFLLCSLQSKENTHTQTTVLIGIYYTNIKITIYY